MFDSSTDEVEGCITFLRDKVSTPKRFKRLRFNPVRALLPWVAIAVGLFMAIMGLLNLNSNPRIGVLFLAMGSALVLVGTGALLLYRWMARRGA